MSDQNNPTSISPSQTTTEYLKEGGGYDVAMSTLAIANGIPIPPSVFKRLRVGIGRLIDGTFDLAAGELHRVNQRRDFDMQVQQGVVTTVAKAGAEDLALNSPEITARVARSMLNQYGLEFENRVQVAKAAIDDLSMEPMGEDVAPLASMDTDWLNFFSNVAGQKSNSEMQRLLGRILAGEIRKPGSFSPLTISVISTLTQRDAQRFERLCRITISVDQSSFIPTGLTPNMSADGCKEVDLDYDDMLALAANQLIQLNMPSIFTFTAAKKYQVSNCIESYAATVVVGGPNRVLQMMPLTQMGHEICRLLTPAPLPWFKDLMRGYLTAPEWHIEGRMS